MKIVGRGEVVVENEQAFVNNSRLPDAVALDLRAQIGAINVTRDRLNACWMSAARVLSPKSPPIDRPRRTPGSDFVHRLPDGEWTGEAIWTAYASATNASAASR